MLADVATMTYEDHAKALAAAYDADAEAALAQLAAAQRRGVTSEALQKARAEMRKFMHLSVSDHLRTNPDAIDEAFAAGIDTPTF